jgi:hypothetical protein
LTATSYNTKLAATEALKESIVFLDGMYIFISLFFVTNSETPFCSFPITIADFLAKST